MTRPLMPLASHPCDALSGDCRVPGDKSISHRSLLIGSLAVGETRIEGLLEGEDVLHTAAAVEALGSRVVREAEGVWRVTGPGIGALAEPDRVLDMGNSGTAARLLLGLLATHPFVSVMTGDASLVRRPMGRVMEPLGRLGARFMARSNGRLPLAVHGTDRPVPIRYRLPVASAQVKSAILLAGLNTPGETTVIEDAPTRDHSELMLRHFGADVTVERIDGNGRAITLVGEPELSGRPVSVPGDPSSAAFVLVASVLAPGSDVMLRGIGLNPLRTGLLRTLQEMGADITVMDRREAAGEPVGDLHVHGGARLRGIRVPADRAPSMIDEYPILAVAAAAADGVTVMEGLAELRVKESDRLGMMAEGLAACGVRVAVDGDTLSVTGGPRPGGATVRTAMDHRIAMSFLVFGMSADAPVRVDDGRFIDTSFPGFVTLMNGLGARIEVDGAEHGTGTAEP